MPELERAGLVVSLAGRTGHDRHSDRAMTIGPARAVVVVGSSHRRAPVEIRERLCLGANEAAEFARSFAGEGDEAVVLATCNRTEVYLASNDSAAAAKRARQVLARVARLPEAELARILCVAQDEVAVRRLLRIASGLDSLVTGESQILGQVRAAHEDALLVGSTGPVLNRLFGLAVRAGKRVRSETGLGQRTASVVAAAVTLAARVLGGLDGLRVVLIGAGKMGELAAADLRARGVAQIVVANRTLERARAVARRREGLSSIPFDQLEEELARADLVISSTRCPHVVLSAGQVFRALRGQRGHRVVFIDIAVPRDLDPAIGDLQGCVLYDIDDLGQPAVESLAGCAKERERAEAIVAEEAARFREWRLAVDRLPTITSLRRSAEQMRAAELARADGRLPALSPRERRAVEVLTTQLVNKLLHLPTVRLKEGAASRSSPGAPDTGMTLALAARDTAMGWQQEDEQRQTGAGRHPPASALAPVGR
jgi:glutamyl-tRNA reductase